MGTPKIPDPPKPVPPVEDAGEAASEQLLQRALKRRKGRRASLIASMSDSKRKTNSLLGTGLDRL